MDKLNLLALAEKGGVAVHDLMLKESQQVHWCSDALCTVPTFEMVNTSIPNPDPLALIAACQKQDPKWEVTFGSNESRFMVVIHPAWWGSGQSKWGVTGYGETLEAALIDAVFQATLPLEPDNWQYCPDCGQCECRACTCTSEDTGHPLQFTPGFVDCEKCHGIGVVEKETENAR